VNTALLPCGPRKVAAQRARATRRHRGRARRRPAPSARPVTAHRDPEAQARDTERSPRVDAGDRSSRRRCGFTIVMARFEEFPTSRSPRSSTSRGHRGVADATKRADAQAQAPCDPPNRERGEVTMLDEIDNILRARVSTCAISRGTRRLDFRSRSRCETWPAPTDDDFSRASERSGCRRAGFRRESPRPVAVDAAGPAAVPGRDAGTAKPPSAPPAGAALGVGPSRRVVFVLGSRASRAQTERWEPATATMSRRAWSAMSLGKGGRILGTGYRRCHPRPASHRAAGPSARRPERARSAGTDDRGLRAALSAVATRTEDTAFHGSARQGRCSRWTVPLVGRDLAEAHSCRRSRARRWRRAASAASWPICCGLQSWTGPDADVGIRPRIGPLSSSVPERPAMDEAGWLPQALSRIDRR